MSSERAREALNEMRRNVGLSLSSSIDEFTAASYLRNASRWALVYLAENKASEFGWAMAERDKE